MAFSLFPDKRQTYIILCLYRAILETVTLDDRSYKSTIPLRQLHSNSNTRFELYKCHHLLVRAKKKEPESLSISRSYYQDKCGFRNAFREISCRSRFSAGNICLTLFGDDMQIKCENYFMLLPRCFLFI